MKIVSVRSILLSFPFPKPLNLTYYGGERQIVKRDAMVVRVEADNGLVGYGPGAASERMQTQIHHQIAPFLEGRTAIEPDALRIQFFHHHARDPELLKVYCAVEVALYDLIGKGLGVPVSELLGGRIRDRIKLYGSSGMYMTPGGYAGEAALAKELGFPAYKMRPGIGPEGDLEAVRRMREQTGPDFGLMVDAHTWWRMGDRNYPPETIEKLAEQMADSEITWLEEPLPPDDHEAYARLKDLALAPLAAGEHEPTEERFLDLIHGNCVDYVQADVVCQGGYAMGKRLFAEVQHRNLRFAFHSWGTALEILAAAQIGVCWPETVVEWLEYPCYSTATHKFMYEFPLAEDLLKQPLRIEDGSLVLPHSPGLGIDVDEKAFEKYPWVPGPWSYFTLLSPRETFAVISDHSVKWTGKS